VSTDLPDPSPLEPAPAPSRDLITPALVFGTIAVMALAVVMTIAALVAADDDDGGSTAAAGGGAPTHVSLSEFAIDPASVTVPVGGSLHVTRTWRPARRRSWTPPP
jgi:hypothetical protein